MALALAAGVFYAGYYSAVVSNEYSDESWEDWIRTFDRIKNFCSEHPAFIELPTGEILILRHYRADYIFMWERDTLPDLFVLDTIRQ